MTRRGITTAVSCAEIEPLISGCHRNHYVKFNALLSTIIDYWFNPSNPCPPTISLEVEFRAPQLNHGYWQPNFDAVMGEFNGWIEVSQEIWKITGTYQALEKRKFRCEHTWVIDVTPWIWEGPGPELVFDDSGIDFGLGSPVANRGDDQTAPAATGSIDTAAYGTPGTSMDMNQGHSMPDTRFGGAGSMPTEASEGHLEVQRSPAQVEGSSSLNLKRG